ncbi:YeeE/YedE family protein [Snodgrassella sp. CFCC 13594]|uniref:YeeE/YedE family protein n=1 Tax=Snodgrassella sp. CFCC 13594 TaxID=1775559 RepID=UPI0008316EED|nr:YeeE/YedE family protein [Snodgrassella sp. CFCC 13594]
MQSDWLWAWGGGMMIGTSVVLMWLGYGRILGVSGMVAGLWQPRDGTYHWRRWFVAGIVVSGWLCQWILGLAVGPTMLGWPGLLVGGFLVGLGTRMAGGCTSGHGVCGLGRLSKRSLVAVLIFVSSGMTTVTLLRLMLGGQ